MDSIQEKQIRKLSVQQLLQNIQQQVETLLSYDTNVPKIEVDIVKENLRKLYELIDSINSSQIDQPAVSQFVVDDIDKQITDLLDTANSQFEDNSKEIASQIEEQEIVLDEQNEDEIQKPEIPNEEQIAAVHSDIDSKQVIANKNILKKDEKKPQKNQIEKVEVDIQKEDEQKTETLNKTEKTVHVLDVMPEEDDSEDDIENEALVINKLKRKPIKSLKTGIGINDKFMIINDLFEGNTKVFNKALNKLDSQEDGQSAIFLLEDMKDENLWQVTDSVYQSFRTYVERRYL